LIIRGKNGATLTDAGKKLLAYCEMIEGLEREFLDDFTEESKELKGIVRLGTFSTIGRSIVLPVFNEFLRQHSCIQFSYMMKELSELPELLMSYRYFQYLGQSVKQLKRKFLDEIYSVIEGVAQGWGVSVLPEHLIKNDKRIKIVNPKKKLPSPVYICFRARPYYPRVFQTALELLQKEIPKRLKFKN
jgi:DNA-binding transcriptional LysR family regulator